MEQQVEKPKKQKDPAIVALSKVNNILKELSAEDKLRVMAFLNATHVTS